MAKAGRKSYFEELKIADRYAELSDEYFLFLKEMFDSVNKQDRKWAAERLEKAYVKMIPQDVTSGGEKIAYMPMEILDKHGIDTGTEGNSEG